MFRIAAFLLLAFLATPASALESAPVVSTRLTATLVTDADTVQPGTPLHLALRLRMKPGWHTYWQNPGDAGLSPELTLTLPPGVTASPIAWPTPHRLPEGPLMTYGYTNEVLLPVTIQPGTIQPGTLQPGAGPLAIEATATWLVCEKVCVPEEGTFRLALPAGLPSPSAQAPLFAAAAAQFPRPSPFEASIAPDGALRLAGAGLSRTTIRDAWFFPDEPDTVGQGPATIGDGEIRIALHPASAFKRASALKGVVVLQDPASQESALQVTAKPGASPTMPRSVVPLWQALLLAVAAGLILNLMPCVFPILAMKALGLARLSGQARSTVRGHALAYTAGVLLAFGGLAAILLALRAAGDATGWGFQFQSPVFVAATALLLFAVGLNLSGVFQFGTSLAGAGQNLATSGGHLGSFFTGLLAVLVATPCTAPFMAAAIAAALASPPAITIAIFLAMGLGLAAPYALFAAIPGLARRLPRPGPWMDVLKGALAFPMYAASAWLIWVVSLQAGADGVLATLAGLVLVGFAAWSYALATSSARRLALLAPIIALLLTAGALSTLHDTAAPSTASAEGTEPFTPARLAELRAQGRPVFVNMTAAWCVSCLVNERIALSPAAVHQSFRDHGVAYLKGDWTRGDPAITAFLREHAHEGVPFYVLYPPGQPQPTILSQILTESEILDVLAKL